MIKKVSFDFDNTLTRSDVQEFAKYLIDLGIEVWIVTSRCSTEYSISRGWSWVATQNIKLYTIAKNINISTDHIIFTNHIDKINYLKDKEFLFHLDDDNDELINIIESGDSCIPVNVEDFDWQETCKTILNIK